MLKASWNSSCEMSSEMEKYPFEIKDLEPDLAKKLSRAMVPGISAIVVGPKRYVFLNESRDILPKIYTMTVKPGDIFGAGLPRSGTTWSQELLWLLANNLDFEKARSTIFTKRFSVLEYSGLPDIVKDRMVAAVDPDHQLTPGSRRMIKTHLPLSLLPPSLLDSAKVVYIARDPRDVAVSIYHISKLFNVNVDLKMTWELFVQNLLPNLQYFEHMKEAWELRNHPNMLFLFYEEMFRDLPATIRKMAAFLDKRLTEEQVHLLTEHLQFDNMKAHVDFTADAHKKPGENYFIRKGKVGEWREEFDDEMKAQADAWIADNLRDTDFRLPQL